MSGDAIGEVGEAIKDFGARSILQMNYFNGSWHLYRAALGHSFVVFFQEGFNLGAEHCAV